jgi:hypothetical protein
MKTKDRRQGERKRNLRASMLVILVSIVVFFGCTTGAGELKVRKEIRDIRKREVVYVLIGDTTNSPGLRQSGKVIVNVVISSVSCSVCFDEIVKVLNESADDTSGVIVSLVITNPDRPSAFQLRRVYGIKVPVFVTDDERLREIGRRLGTSFFFISTPDVKLYNIKPLRSAADLGHFLEKTKNDGFH